MLNNQETLEDEAEVALRLLSRGFVELHLKVRAGEIVDPFSLPDILGQGMQLVSRLCLIGGVADTCNRRQVHRQATWTSKSGMADLSAKPRAGHRRHGFVRCSDHWLRSALCNEAPRYLIRDRDCVYGAAFPHRLRAMGIRDKPIAPGSPWQNGFAERLIGSIRRECVDHVVVLGEPHLRRILTKYAAYYNELRTHRSLKKDAPIHRAIQHVGRIVSAPVLGGLHHQYCRI